MVLGGGKNMSKTQVHLCVRTVHNLEDGPGEIDTHVASFLAIDEKLARFLVKELVKRLLVKLGAHLENEFGLG